MLEIIERKDLLVIQEIVELEIRINRLAVLVQELKVKAK